MRMRLTASRSSAGSWPSVMRVSRATRSGSSAGLPVGFSIAPSSERNAATPPPQVICSDTVLSPIASASTPLDFSAAGNCNADMPSAKATGFNFAATRTCSSVATCALGMPASRMCFLSAAIGQLELASCSVATSVEKPRSASSCNRLAASASGSGGSSVCAVKTHFNGTPKMQWRSRTPAASSWLRISRPTSSGAAVSGSSVSATEKLCCDCSEPLTRRSTTPSSRLPSSARPRTLESFLRFRKLIFKMLFMVFRSRPGIRAPVRPAPSRAGSNPGGK